MKNLFVRILLNTYDRKCVLARARVFYVQENASLKGSNLSAVFANDWRGSLCHLHRNFVREIGRSLSKRYGDAIARTM